MKLNHNDAAVCADSINAQTGSRSAGEIDLYDELTAFAELSPEEQMRLVERPEKTSAETEKTSAEEAEEPRSPEPVLTHPLIEPVEAEATVPPAESASDAGDSNASVERSEVRPELFVRPSGPLGSLTLGFVFTGALSRGVCLACGAESDADDLFCITCGVFIDEIGSTLPVKATCAECKQGIATDEIFCPWCGSVLPAV
jgi:hypothetical protein